METTERENQAPMLWYWSIPENGMDMEDCEKIAKENRTNRRNNKYMDMYIAFVQRLYTSGQKGMQSIDRDIYMPF